MAKNASIVSPASCLPLDKHSQCTKWYHNLFQRQESEHTYTHERGQPHMEKHLLPVGSGQRIA